MNKMQFSVQINSSKEKVWNTLWDDKTFRIWANILDEGTYMVGELIEGNQIQFISSVNGYGVTSLVENVVPNEYLLLKHSADTQNTGKDERDKQWTGGEEVYSLTETDGITTLSAIFDVPAELEDYFKDAYPRAFNKIKELAETNS